MSRDALVATMMVLCFSCLMIVACSEVDNVQSPINEKQKIDESRELIVIEEGKGNILLSISEGISVLTVSYDPDAQILCYDCGDFHLEFGVNYVREYTSYDELEFWLENTENLPQRTEVYVYNGEMIRINVQDNQPTEENFQEFLGFYESNPKINTLEANHDGEILFELLEKAEPQLIQMWEERDPEGYLQFENDDRDMLGRPKWGDYMCNGAALCVSIKCWYGGLANPVCATCASVVSVCLVMDILGLW